MNGMQAIVLILLATAFLGFDVGADSLSIVMAAAMPAAAARFAGHADLPGVRLWYTDSGVSGVPVLLLHANTGNADSWQYNIPGFAEAGYRVIAFDRRGWGRSTANPNTGPQPGTIADDLHALAEYLQLDRFHLVAVAGGGFAAYDYVLWHGLYGHQPGGLEKVAGDSSQLATARRARATTAYDNHLREA
jgi:pimeloyl-ACP methyl ester carboxylesterase